MKNVFLLILSAAFIVSCSESKTVKLGDVQNPNLGESGETTPKPTPAPNPSPSPQNPVQNPGQEPGDGTTPPQTPTVPPEKVARIFCNSTATLSHSFVTLRADVWSDYYMPTIMPYVDGAVVFDVKNPLPLQSDGEEAFILVQALNDGMSEWRIYKSTVNLLSARADLIPISNFGAPTPAAQYTYTQLGLQNRLMAANMKRTSYVYPNDSGTYVWENLKGSKMVLPFSAKSAFSPAYTGADDYLRFDHITSGGMTQKFYNFNTKKTLSLPPPASSKDHQLFGYINNAKTTLYWVEGRPETTWKLRSLSLSSSKSTTVATLTASKNSNIVLPMVFAEIKGETVLAFLEEDLDRDKSGSLFLKNANLHFVRNGADRVFSYSPEIKNLTQNPLDLEKGILRGLFFEPLSEKFYASGIPRGGLVSYDIDKDSWETHAMMTSSLQCLNPEWTVEVPRE